MNTMLTLHNKWFDKITALHFNEAANDCITQWMSWQNDSITHWGVDKMTALRNDELTNDCFTQCWVDKMTLFHNQLTNDCFKESLIDEMTALHYDKQTKWLLYSMLC